MSDKLRAAAQAAYKAMIAAELSDGSKREWEAAVDGLKAALAEPTSKESLTVAEPFGYFQYATQFDAWVQNRDSNKGVAFYTTPQPQREWVGLTDEEVEALASWWPSYDQMPALKVLIKDVTNSLKEKNS